MSTFFVIAGPVEDLSETEKKILTVFQSKSAITGPGNPSLPEKQKDMDFPVKMENVQVGTP